MERTTTPDRASHDDIHVEPREATSGSARPDDDELDAPLWKRMVRQFRQDEIPIHGAHVAFFAVLSFPPAVLVLFSLTGMFGGEDTAMWLTDQLQAAMPDDASTLVEGFVEQVSEGGTTGVLSFGLLMALWSSSGVFMALGRSLDQAYDIPVDERRPWPKERALAVGVALICGLLFLSGSVALLAGPGIASALDLFGAMELAWSILQWPLALLLVGAAFGVCYYLLPARKQKAEVRNVLIGAVVAVVVWAIATAGFRFYISNFNEYSETYGILGAIIVLLIWLWISAIVVLLGGELASELRPREARARR